MALRDWLVTAPPCSPERRMPETGLSIHETLPYRWEHRRLSDHDLDGLWWEGLMILRVINHMESQPVREGEADAALVRLEAKLDLALYLLARTLPDGQVSPSPERITLRAEGCALGADPSLRPGDEIVLSLLLPHALPLALKLPASVTTASAGQVDVRWNGMPEAVVEAWEQWLFRRHRRRVQEQRGAKSPHAPK